MVYIQQIEGLHLFVTLILCFHKLGLFTAVLFSIISGMVQSTDLPPATLSLTFTLRKIHILFMVEHLSCISRSPYGRQSYHAIFCFLCKNNVFSR
ncbi:protein of unknown function [Alteromonas macleodii]|uniref:Uncharacterized protein n=1 Tax=Alteromonas macleodii TaxID=28108 RepID=A0A6T9XZJ7_ALTMA|nr:protein of unknown function [Alteromonas macleodii]